MAPLYITITALMVTSAAQEPEVSQKCVSSGNVNVSCIAKGHNLTFTWRLNNVSLDPADNDNQRGTSSISVEAGRSGNLTCEVTNKVNGSSSSSKTSVHLTDCLKFQFLYAMMIIAVASLLCICAILVYFILLFKKTSQDVSGGNADVGEVMYADVKIHASKKRRETTHPAEQVEYEQIRVHQPDEQAA